MFSFFWLNCREKWLFSPRSWISNEQGPVSSFITSYPHDKPWAWKRKAAQGSLSANRDILQIVALLGCYRLFSTQWLKTLHLSFGLLGVLHGGNVTFQFCKWVCSRTGSGKSWVSLPRVSLQQAWVHRTGAMMWRPWSLSLLLLLTFKQDVSGVIDDEQNKCVLSNFRRKDTANKTRCLKWT